MTPQNPAVRFGLQAAAVAVNAQSGQLRHPDVIDLLGCTLRAFHDDAAARSAVVAFVDEYRARPVSAGKKLQDFVRSWAADVSPELLRNELAQMCPTRLQEWQRRVAING